MSLSEIAGPQNPLFLATSVNQSAALATVPKVQVFSNEKKQCCESKRAKMAQKIENG
jgi:hypothetical protein